MGTWSLPPSEERTPPAERFVWPPRRNEPTTEAPGVEGEHAPVGRTGGVQPPRPPVERSKSVAAIPNPKTLGEHWLDIERVWLDVVAPPLAERMKLEGWTPDSPAEYCSQCAMSVGRDELREDLCKACREGETARPPWQRIVRLGEFAHPLDEWVREVKFTRWRRLGHDLGCLLGEALAPELAAARAAGAIPCEPPLVVPVPMPHLRRLMRGIDHTMAIARGVAGPIGGRVVQPLARDLRPSQTHVAPSSRAANVANSIHPRAAWLRPRLEGRMVIVVDDVSTTTSTLRGACRAVAAIQRAERDSASGKGASPRKPGPIWAAVVARTAPDSHDFQGDGEG